MIGAMALVTVCVGGVGFYIFEKDSLERAFWWSFTTLTTVGYGDVTPLSLGGRVVGVSLMIAGVVLMAFVSATIASRFVHRKIREDKGLEAVVMEHHTVLANWNSSGHLILEHLSRWAPDHLREVVLVSEIGEDRVGELSSSFPALKIRYVHGDPTRDMILRKASVDTAAVVIILAVSQEEARSDEEADSRTLKIAMGVRSFTKDAQVFAEVRGKENEGHLRRAGADEIISGTRIGGILLAAAPLSPGLTPALEELLGAYGNVFRNVAVPESYIGRPFAELFSYFRRERNAIAIALVRETPPLRLNDMVQDSDDFVDAFIKRQIEESAAASDMLRTGRFRTLVNPPDAHQIEEGDRVLIITREAD
jgi:voltage-gated potassium channel